MSRPVSTTSVLSSSPPFVGASIVNSCNDHITSESNPSTTSTTSISSCTTFSNTTFVLTSCSDYCTSASIPPSTSSVVTTCPDVCTSVSTSPSTSSVVTTCSDYCTTVSSSPSTSSVVTTCPDDCTSVSTSPSTSSAVTTCSDYCTTVSTSPSTSSVCSDYCTTVSTSPSTSSVVTTCPDYCTTVNKPHDASSASILPTDHRTLTCHTSEVSSVLAVPEVINSTYTISTEERTACSPPDTNINHMDPLPSFVPAHVPNFKWGELDGTTMQTIINECYNEIVRWKRNLFKVPSGKAGKSFVKELTRLLIAFAEASALEAIALKAVFVMPALLLQKPHKRSKAKEHSSHLDRRLNLWKNGSIDALLKEGRAIQKQFGNINHKSSEDLPRTFAKLLMEGKVKRALNLLSDYSSGGPMCPNEDIKTKLREKHPTRQPPKPSATLTSDCETATTHHPIIFEQIDAQLIHKTTLQLDGAAGPSGLDAGAWKRLCSSFGACSNDLCSAIAAVAKRLCTAYVDPTCISSLVAGRLIALDKCPGIRPIGIGETLRRIIAHAISYVLREDIKTAAGPLQLCAGQESGCEAAIHAIKEIVDQPTNDAVLLVDASNAFNNLNRETAMRNISVLCPSLATVIINTYRSDIPMFIGDETILSQEGTTQGDPLAMAMYAIATAPLIQQLRSTDTHQMWYADDASATSKLHNLKAWWDQLTLLGPDFGYYPNASKSWLVVKEEKYDEACSMFQDTNIQITTDGQRYLGGCIGSASFTESYTKTKVSNWEKELIRLCDIAISQPHAAYAAFTHGLVHRWTFLARTIEGIGHLFQPLEDIILHKFIPALTGRSDISTEERNIMALPVRLGGLGIANPVQQASRHHQASKKITSALTSQIQKQATTVPPETNEAIIRAKNEVRFNKQKQDVQNLEEVSKNVNHTLQRSLTLLKDKGASNWLSVLPIDEHGFALHKGDFRDALCLRYGWRPQHLPSLCVCGKSFSIEHALSCNFGGFPIKRHNELRDLTASLLDEICTGVGIEPTLQPLSNEQMRLKSANIDDGARLDVIAEDFWGTRQRAFFDVRVFNPFAPSLRNTSIVTLYRQKEQEKRRSYDERIREVEHGSFAPLVFSTSGGMGPAAQVVYKRIALLIANKQKKHYSLIISYIRCKITFSLFRSAIMCLRGCRTIRHHSAADFHQLEIATHESRLTSN